MRVIIAGGGTGGHVIPALAVARALRDRNAELLFVGTSRGLENKLVPAAGFALEHIEIGVLKNAGLLTRLRTFFNLPRAIWQGIATIRRFRPDVVFGVGGYASGPVMIAAMLKRIPIVAFEPNYVPGLANRVVARFVKSAATQFDYTARCFRNGKVTGVPVRPEFFSIPAFAGHQPPRLLVTGGSQGAHALNQAMIDAAPALFEQLPGLLVLHQTGEKDLESVRSAYVSAKGQAEVRPFIDDMASAISHADLVLCRSGAGTVAELAAAGRVALFVPFPRAADDHQTRNAQAVVEKGAAKILPESELTSVRLVETITHLLRDPARLRSMSEAARMLGRPKATEEIVAMIEEAAGGRMA